MSDLSFEDRINEVLDKRLRDQTTLPAEFRSWLPRFIEIQDIRLPMSQVSGLYLTGETVDSLGSDVHGRIGMVRGGATPYDFTQVTFDAIYDRWVSDQYLVLSSSLSVADTTTSTSYLEVGPPFSESYLPWRTFNTTGLAPQGRILGRLSTSNASHTASLSVNWYPIDAGGSVPAPNASSWAATTTSTAGSGVIVDSGWGDIPSMTIKDFLLFTPIFKISNAASTATCYGYQILLRWVSA